MKRQTKLRPVGDLCDFSNGHGFGPTTWAENGLPIIRIQNLNGSREFNYFNGEPDPDWIVEPGTLLFAWAGTRGVSFGPTIWNGTRGVLNQHIYRVHPKENVDQGWLYNALKFVTARIEQKAHGFKSTLLHVGKSDITRQVVATPPLPEQQKIADILGTWDEALEKLDALIAAKDHRKRALTQQFLTGKRRLPGQSKRWAVRTLGELIEAITRTVPKPNGAFLAAGIRSHGKGVFLKPAFEPDEIALDELFEIKTDDLIVNITFAWEGAAAIVPAAADGALVSHRFPTFRVRETEAALSFLRHYIRTHRFVFDCGLASPGGAGRNRVLSKSAFLDTEVFVPDAAEQQAIGEILDTADAELRLLRQQRAALDQQKRGLMQQLLTGQKRVRVSP